MAEITSGRARRLLSVGSLTSAVGGSYIWQALKRPFQSSERADEDLLAVHIRNAERMVAGSTELRGAFMKLVQMLSMRTDLFPAEALERLAVVQSSVPPMPYERVREVLTRELGSPPEKAFRRFEREAFAAASLGQVHRGELHDGTAVAVKVQYPGIAETVTQDIRNVRALVRALTTVVRDVMRQDFDREEVVAELEARLREELDYTREAANIERFRRLLASDREVTIPRVYPALSTRCVLTMQYLEGYPLQEILAPGVDPALRRWVAEKLFRLLWRQVLEFGVLHGDPHPGNYLVTHHPKIALLDFGSVRVFEPEIRAGYLRLARGLLARDDREIAAACVALGFAKDDPAPVVQMMHVVCEPLERDEPFDPAQYDLVDRGMQVTQLALVHRIFHAPGHPVLLLRALAGLDGYLKQCGAVLNWHRIFRDVVSAIPDTERTCA
ncbi:MAG TPA: AarF/UbiB family protein [Candidatus Eisenbacteria bacterium]|nr:AarF/UbiB family protein [Candidatus Eisenbacteria bacterium]